MMNQNHADIYIGHVLLYGGMIYDGLFLLYNVESRLKLSVRGY